MMRKLKKVPDLMRDEDEIEEIDDMPTTENAPERPKDKMNRILRAYWTDRRIVKRRRADMGNDILHS